MIVEIISMGAVSLPCMPQEITSEDSQAVFGSNLMTPLSNSVTSVPADKMECLLATAASAFAIVCLMMSLWGEKKKTVIIALLNSDKLSNHTALIETGQRFTPKALIPTDRSLCPFDGTKATWTIRDI